MFFYLIWRHGVRLYPQGSPIYSLRGLFSFGSPHFSLRCSHPVSDSTARFFVLQMAIQVPRLCLLVFLPRQLLQQASFSFLQASTYALFLFYSRFFFHPSLRKAWDRLFLFLPLALLFPVELSQWFLVLQCSQLHVWHPHIDPLWQNLHLLSVSVS